MSAKAKREFNLAIRNFLPDSELMPEVSVSVTTAPLYKKNMEYRITGTDIGTMVSRNYSVRSDTFGRLNIETNGSLHQIGIENVANTPNLSMTGSKIENMDWAVSGQV